jgi:hypothetical protein
MMPRLNHDSAIRGRIQMSEVDVSRVSGDERDRAEGESPDKPLVERAPADSIEPALIQSGNPPRAFEAEDR